MGSVNGIKPDENGNVNIDVSAGEPGKSAYEYAVEGGYTGTEDEFANKLAAEYPIPNWEQNDETAPDYIKNKPFYEIKDTYLSWDANTEGRSSVDAPEMGGTFYKISDLNGFIVGGNYLLELSIDGQINKFPLNGRNVIENAMSLSFSDLIMIIVILKENTTIDIGDAIYSFDETGFYCLVIPELAETGNGYTILMSVSKYEFKQIDEKFVPYAIRTVNDISPDENGNVSIIIPEHIVINTDLTSANLTQSSEKFYKFYNVKYGDIVSVINKNGNISFYNSSNKVMYNCAQTQLLDDGTIILTIFIRYGSALYHVNLACVKDENYFIRNSLLKINATSM